MVDAKELNDILTAIESHAPRLVKAGVLQVTIEDVSVVLQAVPQDAERPEDLKPSSHTDMFSDPLADPSTFGGMVPTFPRETRNDEE